MSKSFPFISSLDFSQNITERESTTAWTGGLGGFMTNTVQAQLPSTLQLTIPGRHFSPLIRASQVWACVDEPSLPPECTGSAAKERAETVAPLSCYGYALTDRAGCHVGSNASRRFIAGIMVTLLCPLKLPEPPPCGSTLKLSVLDLLPVYREDT